MQLSSLPQAARSFYDCVHPVVTLACISIPGLLVFGPWGLLLMGLTIVLLFVLLPPRCLQEEMVCRQNRENLLARSASLIRQGRSGDLHAALERLGV